MAGVVNNTTWVTVEPSTATGDVWRCTSIYHYPPELNSGRHNVFIDAYKDGSRVRSDSLFAIWGWEGQRSDEQSPDVALNKRAPDPCCDIPIEKGMKIWCRLSGYPSDTVRNLHAVIDGTNDGNSWHHHSYLVVFTLQNSNTSQPPITPQPVIEDEPTRLTKLEARVDALEKLFYSLQGD